MAQRYTEKLKKRAPFEYRKETMNESNSRMLQSQKLPNLSLVAANSNANGPILASTVISSQNRGGTVTVSPTLNHFKHSRDVSPVSSISMSGEPIKRKRGRPRILDSEDLFIPFHDTEEHEQQGKYTNY